MYDDGEYDDGFDDKYDGAYEGHHGGQHQVRSRVPQSPVSSRRMHLLELRARLFYLDLWVSPADAAPTTIRGR